MSWLVTEAQDVARVGGKAARLARLRAEGVPVPDAVVLQAGAYQRFLVANRLVEVRDRILDGLDRDPDADLGELAAPLAARRAEAALPDDVGRELDALIPDLLRRHGLLALRSSANLEDLPGHPMSGVFTSRLGIASPTRARAAVREIWLRSLEPATLATLLAADLDPHRLTVAILIQRQVEVAWSGCVFSVHPRRPSESPLVELYRGRGDALMDGRVGAEEEPEADRVEQARGVDAVLQGLFARAMDTELAWDEAGALWVLQTRPQVVDPAQRTDVRWGRSLTRERYPLPLSPLGFANIEKVFPRAIRTFLGFLGQDLDADVPVACRIRQRLHANEDLFDLGKSVRLRLPPRALFGVLGQLTQRLWQRGQPLRDLADLVAAARRGRDPARPFGSAPGSVVAELALDYLLAYLEHAEKSWIGDWEATKCRYLDDVERLEGEVRRGMSVVRYRELEAELRGVLLEFLRPDLVIFALREICFGALGASLELAGLDVAARERRLATVRLPANPTTAMNRRLVELARQRVREGVRAPAFQVARRGFLEEYGHLTSSWDLRDPLLAEEPGRLDSLLEAMVSGGPPAAVPVPAPEEEEELLADLDRHLAPWPAVAAGARALGRRLLHLMRMDEEHHLLTSRIMLPSRRLVEILGEMLVRRGVLRSPAEIYFLDDQEVWRLLEARDDRSRAYLVHRRRRAFERARAEPEEVPTPAPGGRRRGLGASRGRARGRVRRVASLADAAEFRDGEVLVVRTPDPLWTVLYPRAVALVAGTGALLSHGVVAAREYSLPAVIGVAGAFDALADGDEVVVDGDEGWVGLAPDPEPTRDEP